MLLHYLVKYRCSENCYVRELSKASCHARFCNSKQLKKFLYNDMLRQTRTWKLLGRKGPADIGGRSCLSENDVIRPYICSFCAYLFLPRLFAPFIDDLIVQLKHSGYGIRVGPFSCPVCLSVTLVHCGQTVARIKMELGTQVGLGPSHIVLDENSAPSPPKGTAPNFRPISVSAKWLHGSRCHLVWR